MIDDMPHLWSGHSRAGRCRRERRESFACSLRWRTQDIKATANRRLDRIRVRGADGDGRSSAGTSDEM